MRKKKLDSERCLVVVLTVLTVAAFVGIAWLIANGYIRPQG